MGAWIEIEIIGFGDTPEDVAPLVGAWIEIWISSECWKYEIVAPLVGAWIEIVFVGRVLNHGALSLLSWERGLKFVISYYQVK